MPSPPLDVPRLFAMADLVTPMAMRAAATLRLADHIGRGVGTPADAVTGRPALGPL